MMKLRYLLWAFVAVLGLVTVAGCASSYQAYYKDQYITNQVDGYVYSTNFQQVWQAARSLLFKNGYRVVPGADAYTIETDWAPVRRDNTYRRYLVTGYDYGDGRCTVHFDYYEETRNPGYRPYVETGRDYNLEYELIRAVEANQWNAIESAATQYASERMAKENAK